MHAILAKEIVFIFSLSSLLLFCFFNDGWMAWVKEKISIFEREKVLQSWNASEMLEEVQ